MRTGLNNSEQLSHLRQHLVGFDNEQATLMIKSNYNLNQDQNDKNILDNVINAKGSKFCRKSCQKKSLNVSKTGHEFLQKLLPLAK